MPDNVPSVDQIRAYLLANGWQMGESGRAAYLMVSMGHTVRMLYEPTKHDRFQAVFEISLAERRHPADVRKGILACSAATPSQTGVAETDNLGEQMRHRRVGAYRLFWKSGGSSVAVVGQLYDGARWYACANWTTSSMNADRTHLIGTDWSQFERVEEIPAGGDDDD